MSQSANRYPATILYLHWITALLLALMIPIGVWMINFPLKNEHANLRLYDIHHHLGVLVWLLTFWRLAARWRSPSPPLPSDMPAWMRLAALGTHAAMYALLLGMPVLGYVTTNAQGFPLILFDAIEIPSPIGANRPLAELLAQLHHIGALVFVLLIGLHVGAALYHEYVRRDALMSRIL